MSTELFNNRSIATLLMANRKTYVFWLLLFPLILLVWANFYQCVLSSLRSYIKDDNLPLPLIASSYRLIHSSDIVHHIVYHFSFISHRILFNIFVTYAISKPFHCRSKDITPIMHKNNK